MYHKSQIFFYLLSAFLSGVLSASLFSFSQTLIWLILITAIGVIVVVGEKKIILLVVTIVAFFIVGALRFNQAEPSL